MTKAEAFVYNSPKWRQEFQRKEDHDSMADTDVNVYFRYESFDSDHKPIGDPTHRLACYSSHGDSILWVASTIQNVLPIYKWEWYRENGLKGNIEYDYDTVLKDLV